MKFSLKHFNSWSFQMLSQLIAMITCYPEISCVSFVAFVQPSNFNKAVIYMYQKFHSLILWLAIVHHFIFIWSLIHSIKSNSTKLYIVQARARGHKPKAVAVAHKQFPGRYILHMPPFPSFIILTTRFIQSIACQKKLEHPSLIAYGY